MMMTVTENGNTPLSQSIDSTMNSSMRTTSTMFDYHPHHPSWHKPTYGLFPSSSNFFPTHPTGASSSMNFSASPSTTNKSYYPSLVDSLPNFNNSNGNFSRRHTESTLSNSFYPSTGVAPPPQATEAAAAAAFPYASPHPADFYFGWNPHQSSSLMRTHSASFPSYSPSTVYSSSSQPIPHDKTAVQSRLPSMASSYHHHSPFLNLMHPIHFNSPSTASNQPPKRSVPPSKINKRPRLTAHLRSEILKLKAQKPSIFVWEIQQNLLQNGICTSQTIPSPSVIQRVLNESSKSQVTVKEEARPVVHSYVTSSLIKVAPPRTICLTPSPSPGIADGESVSECSICLESYRSGQEVSILACSHEYHSSCIGEWMIKNRSCPMCRKDIHNQPQFVTLLI